MVLVRSGPVTGLTIFIDGYTYKTMPGDIVKRNIMNMFDFTPIESVIEVPTSCGGVYQIQMATNANNARSALSPAVEYEQPDCQTYAVVTFHSINFSYIDDGEDICTDAAEPELEMHINAESIIKNYITDLDKDEVEVNCGENWSFADFPTSDISSYGVTFGGNRIKVPIDLSNPQLDVKVLFWDTDCSVFNCHWEHLCNYKRSLGKYIGPMSVQEWANYEWLLEGEKCDMASDGGERDDIATFSYQIQGVTTK
jgi:hypothetical protein